MVDVIGAQGHWALKPLSGLRTVGSVYIDLGPLGPGHCHREPRGRPNAEDSQKSYSRASLLKLTGTIRDHQGPIGNDRDLLEAHVLEHWIKGCPFFRSLL